MLTKIKIWSKPMLSTGSFAVLDGTKHEPILPLFPTWCSILKIVRTHFAAAGGEEAPRKNERLRREPDNFKFLNDLSINHSSKFFNEK